MRVWVSLSPFKEKKNVRVGVNFNLLRLLKKLLSGGGKEKKKQHGGE